MYWRLPNPITIRDLIPPNQLAIYSNAFISSECEEDSKASKLGYSYFNRILIDEC